MRTLSIVGIPFLLSFLVGCASVSAAPDPMCSEIAAFANATRDSTVRTVELMTDWGGQFTPKEPGEYVMASKTCDHANYQPGEVLCDYLLQNTSTEFADANLNTVLVCLGVAKPTRLVTDVEFLRAKLWSYTALGVRPEIRVGVEFSADSDNAPPSLKISAEKNP